MLCSNFIAWNHSCSQKLILAFSAVAVPNSSEQNCMFALAVFAMWHPRVRPYRQYINDNLWAALMAVKRGGSVYGASKEHGIPRHTLRNWIKRWNINSKSAAPVR